MLAVTLVDAKVIVAGANGQAHKPMFKRGFAPKGVQFLKGLDENILDNVLNLAIQAGITASGGEHPGLVSRHNDFEALHIAVQNGFDQLRISLLHFPAPYAKGPKNKSGGILRE